MAAEATMSQDLKQYIRDVPDFPKPGILFRDITPLLATPEAFGVVVKSFADRYQGRGLTHVAGIESRGFIFGAPLALDLGVGFVPVRKAGKLPAETYSRSYDLEYGQATLELHRSELGPGARVIVIDDLLATGGTAEATVALVEEAGAEVVEVAFVIELAGLNGRDRLGGREVHALLVYD